MTTASYITLLRVLLIFPIIIFSSFQSSLFNYLALVLFIFAGLTDYLDGYIARKTNSVSELGGLLDLLADKLLISAILIWLLFLDNSILLMIPIIIIVLRELIISSLRQFALERRKKIEVSMLGKGKTTIHLISIGLIIINPEFGKFFYIFSVFFLWVAAFISIISLIKYLNSTIKTFKV
tara:strand:- start:70 stop:609 length:540 start_codon:yes stop_codon:yes gene_type:complete